MKIEKRRQNNGGFTLIEMLIVVILLGILAMLIVPQISITTEEAELNTLQSNMSSLRSAIELYYHQHGQTYPGENDNTGVPVIAAAAAATAFVEQLTQYTDIDGDCQVNRDATHIYGPYLKGTTLPTNPFNDFNTVLCDIVTDDITARVSDGSTGWKFYTINGVLMANDGGHDSL